VVEDDMPREPRMKSAEEDAVMVKKAVEHTLRYMHLEHLEVPFIAMYRKEYIQPLLRCRPEEWMEVSPVSHLAP
jgi:transcriptional accessory protein Tex/SPT6